MESQEVDRRLSIGKKKLTYTLVNRKHWESTFSLPNFPFDKFFFSSISVLYVYVSTPILSYL